MSKDGIMTNDEFAKKLYDDTMRFLTPNEEEIKEHKERMTNALLEALSKE